MPTIFRDSVTINGVAFNGGATPDGAVSVWGLDNLDGWDRTPEISTPVNDRVSQDGAVIAARSTLRGRVLYVEGYVLAADRLAAENMKTYLVGTAFPRSTDIEVVREGPIEQSVIARRTGAFEYNSDIGYGFRWATTLLCADPLKYSTSYDTVGPIGVSAQSSGGRTYPKTYPIVYVGTVTSASTGTVVNSGTAPTPPRIQVYGPLSQGGWRISNDTTGEYIGFNIALSASDILIIDHAANTALLNGYDVTSTLLGDFWRVQPGTNNIKLYADASAATFFITTRSAWE